MRRYRLLLGVSAVLLGCGVSWAFSLNSVFLVERRLVHISGADTYPTPSSPPPSAPALSTPATIYHTPDSKPGSAKPYGPTTQPQFAPQSASPNGIGFGSHPRASGGSSGRVGSVAMDEGGKNATVTGSGGRTFTAEKMFAGVDNELRVESGGGRVNVRLSQVQSIEFGGRNMGRLDVKVKLSTGDELSGTIYSGAVFEFVYSGRVQVARAEELNAVNFKQEGQ